MRFAVDLDPEEFSWITTNFQNTAVAAITRMGGTIATVAPDQIMALFGYPEVHDDDAERAVDAGLEMLAKIGQLESPLGKPLQAQVAVATGLTLASQNQVVGKPLAIAEGLCNVAAPDSVLVAPTTRRLLTGVFVCGNPEPYQLAGLSEAVSACRVTGKRTVETLFTARTFGQDYRRFRPQPRTSSPVETLQSSQVA
jgi:class 3 adenylate cyclase